MPPPPSTAPAVAPSKVQKADSIKVYLRVRPPMGRELIEQHTYKNLSIDPKDDTTVRIRDPRLGTEANAVEKKFSFHKVFGPQSTQEEVYDAFAREAVDDALQGYHGVMFVYGQTGSGKTFTMSHEEPGREGMLQRSIKSVWDRINADPDYEYVCSVSYVQLYNEILTDMLEPNRTMNTVRLSGIADRRSDVVLINDTTNQPIAREVNSYLDTINMFKQGVAQRVSASTGMNEVSSRSHTVFTLYVKKQARTENSALMSGGKSLEGRLVICDLAGSERIKKTEAKGQQLAEATHINGSLLVLGRVVAALTDAKSSQHVPYRESKLTRLLQYSLSGWGKTRLVVNVSPSDDNTEETLSAIQFGQRAIQIKQTAEKHETLDYKALYLDLQAQQDKLASEAFKSAVVAANAEKESLVAGYEDKIKLLESETELLRAELARKDELIDSLQNSNTNAGRPSTDTSTTPIRHQPSMATSPGGEGSFALSPNGSSMVDGTPLLMFAAKAKEHIASREKRITELTLANEDYRVQLSRKEATLYALAQKYKSEKETFEAEKMSYEKSIAELTINADSRKGVDFLNPNTQMDDEDTKAATQLATGLSDAASTNTNATQAENTDRLWQAIRVLASQLSEANAYNRKARLAIRMLAMDLDDARSATTSR